MITSADRAASTKGGAGSFTVMTTAGYPWGFTLRVVTVATVELAGQISPSSARARREHSLPFLRHGDRVAELLGKARRRARRVEELGRRCALEVVRQARRSARH